MPTRKISASSANGESKLTQAALQTPIRNRRISSKVKPKKTNKRKTSYYATIFPQEPISDEFASAILKLEEIFGAEIWLIVQNGSGECSDLSNDVFKRFRDRSDDIEKCGDRFAFLLDSPGGDADAAYRLGRLFQRCCPNAKAIIPHYAKSAATLLALSAKDIFLGRDAELGPLDVQLLDREKEDFGSALNSVQSLERLNAFGMIAIDNMMGLLLPRTGKKIETLLPMVLNYASHFVRPLLEKIDVVDYTRRSRDLKVAEEYAARLLRRNYSWKECQRIARALVEKYPDHGFVIDFDETAAAPPLGLGLRLESCTAEANRIFRELGSFFDNLSVVGRIVRKEQL